MVNQIGLIRIYVRVYCSNKQNTSPKPNQTKPTQNERCKRDATIFVVFQAKPIYIAFKCNGWNKLSNYECEYVWVRYFLNCDEVKYAMPWIQHNSIYTLIAMKMEKIFRDWNLRLCSFMFEYNFFPCVLTTIGVVPHLLGLNVGTKATCTCGWFEVILTYFLFVVATPNILRNVFYWQITFGIFLQTKSLFFFLRFDFIETLHCIVQNRWRRHLMKVSCFFSASSSNPIVLLHLSLVLSPTSAKK